MSVQPTSFDLTTLLHKGKGI